MKYLISLILFFSMLLPAHAAIEAYTFDDPAKESAYKELIEELRCLVCQNQNLAASDADLAKDLRQQTYDMLHEGKDRDQIVDYMVNRYGDFVMYKPPFKSSTMLLWLGPFVLLLFVLVMVMLKIKKTRKIEVPEQKDMQNAHDLLSSNDSSNGDVK